MRRGKLRSIYASSFGLKANMEKEKKTASQQFASQITVSSFFPKFLFYFFLSAATIHGVVWVRPCKLN